jgi:hypothetical protein
MEDTCTMKTTYLKMCKVCGDECVEGGNFDYVDDNPNFFYDTFPTLCATTSSTTTSSTAINENTMVACYVATNPTFLYNNAFWIWRDQRFDNSCTISADFSNCTLCTPNCTEWPPDNRNFFYDNFETLCPTTTTTTTFSTAIATSSSTSSFSSATSTSSVSSTSSGSGTTSSASSTAPASAASSGLSDTDAALIVGGALLCISALIGVARCAYSSKAPSAPTITGTDPPPAYVK